MGEFAKKPQDDIRLKMQFRLYSVFFQRGLFDAETSEAPLFPAAPLFSASLCDLCG